MITCPFFAPAFLNFPTNKKCTAMFNQTACQYFAMDMEPYFELDQVDTANSASVFLTNISVKLSSSWTTFLKLLFQTLFFLQIVVPDIMFKRHSRRLFCKLLFRTTYLQTDVLTFFFHISVLFNLIVQIIVPNTFIIGLEERLLSKVCLQKMFQTYFPTLCVVNDR